jgi:hypothetical protein
MRPAATSEAAERDPTALWAMPRESDGRAADSFESALARAALEAPREELGRTDSDAVELTDIDEGFEVLEANGGPQADGTKDLGASPDTRRQERMAEFSREEVLRRVRMKQSLKRAGMNGIDLSGQTLEGVDFGRADLEGANLSNAKLRGSNFASASLRGASLKGADLGDTDLSKSDLDEADLTGAKISGANLEHASLEGSILAAADLSGANLRHAVLTGADLTGASLGQATVAGAIFTHARLASVVLDWIDVSPEGDGSQRLDRAGGLAFLSGRDDGKPSGSRYFGKGDVLRDATLEFGDQSVIHIDSRFENCSITLGDGADLTIGEAGVLKNCEIAGSGKITVHGRFFERSSPGIVGAKSIVVSARGAVVGGIEQAPEATVFAFEPGSRLRVKILRPRQRSAAE